nr:MAG TPA: hypothetical protein [Caudoviricetes sp.]
MKIVTKKAERRQQEQVKQQIVRAANYGYNTGYDTAMSIVYVTIGSALISAMISNVIADQSYKRSIMKLAKTNFNIDKTIVHMSNKMVDITNAGKTEKGFKKFVKFLFDCDRAGFEFWNPDVSRMVLIIGFDNFRDRISELGIIIGKLDGKGKKTIQDAFQLWKKCGSNVFPYGSASAWKELLIKDYELTSKLEQTKVLLNNIKSGTIQSGEVDVLNTLLGFIESEYAGAASQMSVQSTKNCAAYRNAEHFKGMIEAFFETLNKLGVPYKMNDKRLRIKRIDSSTIEVIQSSRVEKIKRSPLDFLPHRGSRTLEPPKQTDSNGSSKKPSKKKKASQRDEDLDEDFDDEFDDDFFDEEDDDFEEGDEFKEVVTPKKKSKKPVKKAPVRKKPEPEPEPEDDESDSEDDFDEEDLNDETEDSNKSNDAVDLEVEVDDAEEDGPAAKKAYDSIVYNVKLLHMNQSNAKRNRLKQQLHSKVTSFMSKYNVTKEDLFKNITGLKEVY